MENLFLMESVSICINISWIDLGDLGTMQWLERQRFIEDKTEG
jgi:hypothetical protein